MSLSTRYINDNNIISSNVIFMSKVNDENSLMLKENIAPHGNEESHLEDLKGVDDDR